MPKETTTKSGVFKEWFDQALYEQIADSIQAIAPQFDRVRFLQVTLDGIEERELMARLRQTSVGFKQSVPGGFRQQLKVLLEVAGPQENGLIGCWYSDFIGQFGLEHPKQSLPALAHVTQFGSAEFAIREFLVQDRESTLQAMIKWARDPNEHVRRLASEGSRPRLPWGRQLKDFIEQPEFTREILETLRDDPSLYVRKSVANHLNDITKDNPAYVLDLVSGWDRSSSHTSWIVKQGLRTLVKKADPKALELMGVGQKAVLDALEFSVIPRRISLGDQITMKLTISSAAKKAQDLLVDYLIHYVKANGKAQPKVFKWKQLRLDPGQTISLSKTQTIKDFSTRKHHAGHHVVEIQINGARLAQSAFELKA